MEILERKSEPIKIGWPTNSRMAEDCTPMRDALELEGQQGLLKSRFIPDAVFRTMRVIDIARFLKKGIYDLGIIGDDTAIEMDLEGGSPYYRFSVGKPTKFSFFVREEEKNFYRRAFEESLNPKFTDAVVLTSYPKTAQKIAKDEPRFENITIQSDVDGQIESMVRNRDIQGTLGGMDIVRTGRTLEEFRLALLQTFFVSRPGLWEKPRSNKIDKRGDVIVAIRERLGRFILPTLWGCDAP